MKTYPFKKFNNHFGGIVTTFGTTLPNIFNELTKTLTKFTWNPAQLFQITKEEFGFNCEKAPLHLALFQRFLVNIPERHLICLFVQNALLRMHTLKLVIVYSRISVPNEKVPSKLEAAFGHFLVTSLQLETFPPNLHSEKLPSIIKIKKLLASNESGEKTFNCASVSFFPKVRELRMGNFDGCKAAPSTLSFASSHFHVRQSSFAFVASRTQKKHFFCACLKTIKNIFWKLGIQCPPPKVITKSKCHRFGQSKTLYPWCLSKQQAVLNHNPSKILKFCTGIKSKILKDSSKRNAKPVAMEILSLDNLRKS